MPIAYIQSAENALSNVTSVSKAFPSNNTAGNLLVAAIGIWKIGSFDTPTVTDSVGNIWTKVLVGPRATASGQSQCFLFVAYNCAGGPNTVTVTTNVAAATDLAIHEYSGVASVNALDQNAATQIGGSSLSFSLTTQYANELLFCFGFNQTTRSATFTPSAGWTGREQTSNPSGECMKTFDQIVSSAGTYSNTLTCSSVANGYHLLAASFSDMPRATDLVQSESVGNVGTSVSKAFRVNNAGGSLLVLAIGAWVSSGTIPTPTISDSAGNTWMFLASTPTATASGQSKAWLYYVSSCASGANTVTVTFSASCNSCIAIHEYVSPVSSPVSAAAEVRSALTVSSGDVTTDGTGILFSCGYDQQTSDGFNSAFTGRGWQMRECAGSTGKTGLVSFGQIALAGSYSQSLTIPTTGISLGLHAIAVAFTGGAIGQKPQVFVIT